MTSRPEELTCDRCGIDFTLSVAAVSKRRLKGQEKDLCSDCQTIDKPIVGYYNNCRAWSGDVDELDRPIRNGRLYKPGIRTCNRADCVRTTHIIPAEIPQNSPVRRSEPVKRVERVNTPRAVIKPPKAEKPVKPPKPVKLPKALLDALEAERLDQTYRGEPKRTLKQIQKAVELERYRATPR